MIPHAIDVASRVSSKLSAFLRSRVEDADCEQPVSLGAVRHFLTDLLPAEFKEAQRLHRFDITPSLLDELDALIEEFGSSAWAIDFIQANASEPLARAIEAVINDETQASPPTLAAIKDAIVAGLGAHLVGEGVLDEDEDDTLLAEIDALIERLGADALAEEALNYE